MGKILIVCLLFSLNAFSQFRLIDKFQEEKTFRQIHRPSTENKLSKYLKRHIKPEELKNLKYKTSPNLHNSIRAQFDVSRTGNPGNFRIYTGNRALNKKLTKLLKAFLVNEIPNLADLFQARNRVQLFSRENNENIINASTVIVSNYPPVCNDCINATSIDLYGCFHRSLEKFITTNFDKNIFKKEDITGFYKLPISFDIDKKGKLQSVNATRHENSIFVSTSVGKPDKGKIKNTVRVTKNRATILNSKPDKDSLKQDNNKATKFVNPSEGGFQYSSNKNQTTDDTINVEHKKPNAIAQEIKRLLKLYEPNIITPAKRNVIPIIASFSHTFNLFIPELLTQKEVGSLRNTRFTSFFKKALDPALVAVADKPLEKPKFTPKFFIQSAQVKVFFNFDTKGKLFQVWANSLNEKLNKEIVKHFKKYPLETLNLDKSINKLYSLVVIRDIATKKEILCDEEVKFSVLGEFTECNDCKNMKDIKHHNRNAIENYIKNKAKSANYSFKLANKSISDKTNEIVMFLSISEEGKIQPLAIHVRDQQGYISENTNEAIYNLKTIIEDMPDFTKPHINFKSPSRMKEMVFRIVKN